MAVNKVIFGGETVVDLTADTVTPETLAEGVTAHDASGQQIAGTMRDIALQELKQISGEEVDFGGVDSAWITPDVGYDGMKEVLIAAPDTLKDYNIISGVTIFGVEGTAEVGGGGSGNGSELPKCSVTVTSDDLSDVYISYTGYYEDEETPAYPETKQGGLDEELGIVAGSVFVIHSYGDPISDISSDSDAVFIMYQCEHAIVVCVDGSATITVY